MIFQIIIYHITHSNSSISTSWSPFPIFPFLILAKFFLSNAKSPAKSSSISRLWLSVKLLLLQLRCVRLWHLRAPPASWGCEPAWAGPGSAPWAPPSAASSPRTAASPGVVVAALPHCSCVIICRIADQLDDGGGERHPDEDVDCAHQHVGRLVPT